MNKFWIAAAVLNLVTALIHTFLGSLYLLFGTSFIVMSFVYGEFLFQWTLLMPVGVLALVGKGRS